MLLPQPGEMVMHVLFQSRDRRYSSRGILNITCRWPTDSRRTFGPRSGRSASQHCGFLCCFTTLRTRDLSLWSWMLGSAAFLVQIVLPISGSRFDPLFKSGVGKNPNEAFFRILGRRDLIHLYKSLLIVNAPVTCKARESSPRSWTSYALCYSASLSLM